MTTYGSYIDMQREFYNRRDLTVEEIVGFYDEHEKIPYETHLLHDYGDFRFPIFPEFASRRALDFGCGPGRMVRRMSKLFAQVDGVDISERLIEEARLRCPGSEFWVNDGDNLGGAATGAYDFVYSTIAMQHIAVRRIRLNLLGEMHRVLKPGGAVCLQFGYNPRHPYVKTVGQVGIHDNIAVTFEETEPKHAAWMEDRVTAEATNSGCDVMIGPADLPLVRADFEGYFDDVKMWSHEWHRVEEPNGIAEPGYWATHHLYVQARRA